MISFQSEITFPLVALDKICVQLALLLVFNEVFEESTPCLNSHAEELTTEDFDELETQRC